MSRAIIDAKLCLEALSRAEQLLADKDQRACIYSSAQALANLNSWTRGASSAADEQVIPVALITALVDLMEKDDEVSAPGVAFNIINQRFSNLSMRQEDDESNLQFCLRQIKEVKERIHNKS